MKAMILAAGMGSRLSHITKDTPKCLIDVGGQPIIRRVISSLQEAGVEEFVVNLHYKADAVRTYLDSLNDSSLKIQFSYEEDLLDTGGGLLAARSLLKGCDHVFVHNADIYSELSLSKMLQAHCKNEALVSLYTRKTEDQRVLLFSKEARLLGWRNKASGDEKNIDRLKQPQELGFCGISLVSTKFFDYLDGFGSKFSIISSFLKAAEMGERVVSFEDNDAYWIDMGTPEKLEELRARVTG